MNYTNDSRNPLPFVPRHCRDLSLPLFLLAASGVFHPAELLHGCARGDAQAFFCAFPALPLIVPCPILLSPAPSLSSRRFGFVLVDETLSSFNFVIRRGYGFVLSPPAFRNFSFFFWAGRRPSWCDCDAGCIFLPSSVPPPPPSLCCKETAPSWRFPCFFFSFHLMTSFTFLLCLATGRFYPPSPFPLHDFWICCIKSP